MIIKKGGWDFYFFYLVGGGGWGGGTTVTIQIHRSKRNLVKTDENKFNLI